MYMKKLLTYIAILTAMLIWAGSGIAIKHALAVFPPLTLIVTRFTLAVLLMLVVGLACRGNSMLGLNKLQKKDIPFFLLGGFFEPVLYYLLETYTYDALSSPTIAETLLSTSPILAPIFAYVILKERVTKFNILGIIISSVGMIMLVLLGSSSFGIGSKWGLLLAFAAVCAAVFYTIVLRRIPETYNSLSIVFYTQLVALLFFYPMWGVVEGSDAISFFSSLTSVEGWQQALLSIGYLAACSSVIAFILYCHTIRQIGVTRTNAFNNIRPMFTAIIMFLFFGEHLPWGKVAGILLIIIGLFISQWQPRKKSLK